MLWDREISKNVDIVRNQGYQLGRRRTKIWNGKSWGRTLWFWIEIGDSHIKKLLTSPSSATACSTSQFRSVAQSCSTLCDPMDCSTPSFPVHHQLLELAQTHVHWVGDAIQQSHLLLPPSPPSLLGSSVHEILQAIILGWVAIPFPGDPSDTGIKPGSPALQADCLPSEPPGTQEERGPNH